MNLLILFAIQQAAWQDGSVRVLLDRPLGNWSVTVSGKRTYLLPSEWYSDKLYIDSTSHSLLFFGEEGIVYVFSKKGKLRAKIAGNDIGRVRNCFVGQAHAVYNDGARSTGTWEYGPKIANWLRAGRTVRCLDLMTAKVLWNRSELEVGCPIYLGAKNALSIGLDNVYDAFVKRKTPIFSIRTLNLKDGAIIRRQQISAPREAAEILLDDIVISTDEYLPKVTRISPNSVEIEVVESESLRQRILVRL